MDFLRTGRLPEGEGARFFTRSGLLKGQKRGNIIELDFPAKPEESAEAPAGLAEALGTSFQYVCKNKFDYLAEAISEEVVRSLKPDFAKLREVEARGVMITSRAKTGPYDFISRFFRPPRGGR
jgi:predicted PhzF superfamily epimerase YddE/YHI9